MTKDKFVYFLDRMENNLNESIYALKDMDQAEKKELLQRLFKIDREIIDLKDCYKQI